MIPTIEPLRKARGAPFNLAGKKPTRPPKSEDFVKPRAIALFSGDGELQNAAMTAVLGSRRGLRLGSSIHEALRILERDLSDLDMVIVDLDLDVHGIALLKALTFCCNRIPVVAIKSRENIAAAKGAVACLDKPTTSKQLSAIIQQATTAPPKRLGRESVAPRNCLGPGLWTDFPGEIALSP
jgi:DNA-binding NtrC family response regulator